MTQQLQRVWTVRRPERIRRPCGRVFVVLAFLLVGMAAVEGTLANQNKRVLLVVSIEGVLRLQEEDIDLGTAALILSRDWGTPQTLHSVTPQD